MDQFNQEHMVFSLRVDGGLITQLLIRDLGRIAFPLSKTAILVKILRASEEFAALAHIDVQ